MEHGLPKFLRGLTQELIVYIIRFQKMILMQNMLLQTLFMLP